MNMNNKILMMISGRPKPTVTWWKDGELIDAVVDVPEISEITGSSSKFTVNHLFIPKVTRSLWGSKLECKAQSEPMKNPIIREVPLDIYRKYSPTLLFLLNISQLISHTLNY